MTMKFVEPIRDIKKVAQIKNMLKGQNKIRDLLLFELGINSALRISDLLSIKVGDVFDDSGETKDFFEIIERKTSKTNRITLTSKVKQTLKSYYELYPNIIKNPSSFLFYNQKFFPLGSKAITRKMAWVMIDKWCHDVGLKGRFGAHSLRKTRGFFARQNGIPMELIIQKLNHSSYSITKRYLGVTNDEIAEACNKLDL